MDATAQAEAFQCIVLPHLDPAYNLARWLTKNDQDAEDVVQEAMMRAYKFVGQFAGQNSRAWVLTIVRHTCFTWLRRNRPGEFLSLTDKESGDDDPGAAIPLWTVKPDDPETSLMRQQDRDRLNRLIEALPAEFREVLILRELEDLSYEEIAEVAGVPIGTVMSRLSRARKRLQRAWAEQTTGRARHEL